MLCAMPQCNPAWLKHHFSHVATVILLNSIICISANCAQDTCTDATLQLSSCSQLLCLEIGNCNVRLVWTACYEVVHTKNGTARCSNKSRPSWRPYAGQHLVSEPAISFVVKLCSSARPSTSRTLVPLLETTLESTLARPRQRA
jgi:hypothetical protein